ncbi:MAG: Tad domain-containing protein [Acidimicrobiales bacterium]|nr:Tad domain-containing protein [Acidimicrobiales bacterium]
MPLARPLAEAVSLGEPPAERERGAAMIIVSVTAIMSLFFVALGVDVALLYNQRRQTQSAVDLAALGAAQDLYDDAAVIAAVSDILASSEVVGVTPADLDRCTTETIDANYTKLPNASCISLNPLRTRIRIRVPDQSSATAFAQVFGVSELRYTAASVAGVEAAGQSNVLPFWISLSANGYSCLKSGADNVPDPLCSGSTVGNFGYANFGIWGDEVMGTTTDCTGSGSNRMPQNTAMGLDHKLSILNQEPHFGTAVTDHLSCGSILEPNSMDTLTGNMNNTAGEAFYSGGPFADGQGSRLARVNDLSWSNNTTVAGYTLDDNPLWEFIGNIGGTDVPNSCQKNQFTSLGVVGADTHLPNRVAIHLSSESLDDKMIKLIERCITHYEGNQWNDHGLLHPPENPTGCTGSCDDPVFNRNDADDPEADIYDIQYSPRFGYVPRIHIDNPGGSTTVNIIDLEPIFIQRLYGGNCNNSGCQVEFDPGVGYSTGGNASKAPAVTSFILPNGMLPDGLGEADAAYKIGLTQFVSVIE